MFVTRFMSKTVTTVTPDVLLPQVKNILSEGDFRHLPVVDTSGKLAGILTDRDLRSAYPSALIDENERLAVFERINEMKVSEIMTDAVAKLTLQSTLDDALLLFDRSKVGALPVIDDQQKVVGILSIRDLLTAYKQLFGLGEKGSALVAVEDDGKLRPLSRLTEALENGNIPFSRLIKDTHSESDMWGKLIYIRVHTHNVSGVHTILMNAGFRTVIPGE